MPSIIPIYQRFVRFAPCIAAIALLAMRLGWGWELFEAGHGHLKYLNEKTVPFFESLHIPMPKANAIISGTTELVGGILLMLGLGARLVAIPLFFNFCVAYATASREAVKHVFADPDKFVDDAAFPFLMLSLLVIGLGPGLLSVDGLLKHTVFKKHNRPTLQPVDRPL